MIGFEVGYPGLGFALGSLAGQALFPTQLPSGPKLTDNRTTTATIGSPVPIVFGTATVAGTVMWLAHTVEHQTTSGGKGGPQQQLYNYTQSIAIGLCEAVADGDTAIGGLTRIWENGLIVYDIRPQLAANTATGALAETDAHYLSRLRASANYAEKFTLHVGSEVQVADPTIEGVEGFGNVPAFRGLAYIVFPNRALTISQGLRHPNFTFEVYQSGSGKCVTTSLCSNSVLYPWVGGGLGDPSNPLNANSYHIDNFDPNAPHAAGANPGNNNRYPTLAAAFAFTSPLYDQPNEIFVGYSLPSDGGHQPTSLAGAGATGGGNGGIAFGAQYQMPDPHMIQMYFSWRLPSNGTFNAQQGNTSAVMNTPSAVWIETGYLRLNTGVHASNYPDHPPVLTRPSPWSESTGNPGYNYPYWWYQSGLVAIDVTREPVAPLAPCAGLLPSPGNPGYAIGTDGSLVKCNNWVLDTTHNYLVLQTYDPGGSDQGHTLVKYPLNPTIPLSSASNTQAFWTAAYNAAVANGSMPAGYTYHADAGGGAMTYPKPQTGAYTIDQVICEGSGLGASVAEIVKRTCSRAGLDSVDVSDLASIIIPGYAISSISSASNIISPLRSVAFFDAVQSGTVLKFPTRGKAVVATLTTDDFGAFDAGTTGNSGGTHTNTPPAITTARTDETTLPRRVRLHYKAVSRDYQDAEQDSPFRLTTSAVNDLDIAVPFILGDTQARQCAEVLWSNAWSSQNGHELSVDQSKSELEVADAIAVPIDGFLQRLRIVSDQNAAGVLRKLSCVRDDALGYISHAVAEPPLTQPQSLLMLAQTKFELLDLPALQDADNDAGFYVAAQRDATTGDSWNGCVIYKSLDGGATFTALFSNTVEATIGTLAAAVPVSQSDTYDMTTVITVNVASNFTFESVSDAALDTGSNAAAMGADGRWEIVQFATATQVSPTQWHLSRLLRGRRGTEHNIGRSVTGDSFVMLSGGDLNRVILNTGEIGASRLYRAASIGGTVIAGTDQTFAGHAQALVPFSPVRVKAVRQTNGDILITWIRRARLGHTLTSSADIPLGEASENYSIEIIAPGASPATVLRTVATTTQSYLYTVALQGADFAAGALPLTSISVAIYQLSAVVGRGTPDRVTMVIV